MEVTRLRIFPSSPSHIGAYPNRDAVGAFRAMEYVKRGAFDCFTVVVCPNRTAFSCPHVGAYCIRSTNVPFMGRMVQMIDCRCAFLSPAGPFCGAYAIRPYPDGRKMIAVGACFAALPEKQAAFGGCYGVGGGKCGAFSCPRVGAYCIRPTDDPFIGRMIQMIDHRCAFLSPAGPFGGAYAIRPYRVTRKMIAFGACSIVLPQKQAAFGGCYGVGGGKFGAFLCLWVGIILRRRCGVFAVSKKTLHSPPLRQRS